MLIFLAEMVFLMELALFISGLILLYKARKEASRLLNWAAGLLIIGSLGAATCTGFYSLKYYNQGAFDNAYFKGNITIKKIIKKRKRKRIKKHDKSL